MWRCCYTGNVYMCFRKYRCGNIYLSLTKVCLVTKMELESEIGNCIIYIEHGIGKKVFLQNDSCVFLSRECEHLHCFSGKTSRWEEIGLPQENVCHAFPGAVYPVAVRILFIQKTPWELLKPLFLPPTFKGMMLLTYSGEKHIS